MRGLMMDTQLTITGIMRHAELNYPDTEVVSVTADNPLHRYTYKDWFRRSRQLANALKKLGAVEDDCIATLAWNDYRHLELYYATSCSGMICHTINPRLFPEQVAYIVNHAEDKFVFVDLLVYKLMEALHTNLPSVKGYIILTDAEHMPETSLPNVYCYEDLIAAESDQFEWPDLDENTACVLCYTSGTTGNPKGVLYSHRSAVLHAYAGSLPSVLNLKTADVLLPIVPMFHVNAWGLPYAAPINGCKLVMPGPKMADGETLHFLLNSEKVTFSAGVPTVWLALLDYLDKENKSLDTLRRLTVGGAACPLSIIERFRDDYDVEVMQGWGMTEMSPLGTLFSLKAGMEDLSKDEKAQLQLKQGRGVFGCEMKIVDEDNNELPWDGVAFGALKVRGPWVCSAYFKADNTDSHDADGWFDTGDVANIDAQGYMQITDRTKDVIKSGGEWISSIELENIAVDHPDVTETAVIGRYHPKWTERPLLIVISHADSELNKADILKWFDGKVATWMIPNDVVFVDELPHTATGKLNKLSLRDQFKDYQFPDA
ncbi:MAG: 3-(methylthio)propionyl-CoA ligase [Xanthomonadales bacterium]|nr:3-(methylthio)propionyl-CoA ligase [Xanthomonadales bacterium]